MIKLIKKIIITFTLIILLSVSEPIKINNTYTVSLLSQNLFNFNKNKLLSLCLTNPPKYITTTKSFLAYDFLRLYNRTDNKTFLFYVEKSNFTNNPYLSTNQRLNLNYYLSNYKSIKKIKNIEQYLKLADEINYILSLCEYHRLSNNKSIDELYENLTILDSKLLFLYPTTQKEKDFLLQMKIQLLRAKLICYQNDSEIKDTIKHLLQLSYENCNSDNIYVTAKLLRAECEFLNKYPHLNNNYSLIIEKKINKFLYMQHELGFFSKRNLISYYNNQNILDTYQVTLALDECNTPQIIRNEKLREKITKAILKGINYELTFVDKEGGIIENDILKIRTDSLNSEIAMLVYIYYLNKK